MKKQVEKASKAKRSLRLILTFVLVLQIGVAPALAQPEHAPREVKPPDPTELHNHPEIFQDFYQDPHNREYVRKFAALDKAYSEDTLPPSSLNYDPLKIANQRVEIIKNGTAIRAYSLNDFRVEPIEAGYSSLRIGYSAEKKELYFEGVVGAQADGTEGDVVVRHVIPNMDVVSYARDFELLTYIDSKGSLHAIDMGFATAQVFKSPIPVVTNLWSPSSEFFEKYQPLEYKLQYHFRGLSPYNENQLTEYSIIPQNAKGDPLLQAGDVYITFQNSDGSQKVLGFFSRQIIHKRLQDAATVLLSQASLVNPKKEFLDFLALRMAGPEPSVELYKMNPLLRTYLLNLNSSQLKTLQHRIESNEGSVTRAYDQYTLPELMVDSEFLNSEFESAKNTAIENQKYFGLTLRDEYHNLLKQHSLAPSTQSQKESVMKRLMKSIDSKTLRKLASVTAVGAAVSYISFPFLYEWGLTGLEIPAMNWIYEHMYTHEMQSAYKYPLVYSMTALLLMAPMTILASITLQGALKQLNTYVQHQNTPWAHRIRDAFKNWSHLTHWQFMGSLGIRQVFLLSYPPMLALFKYIFQQRAFLSAVENGVNPFRLVKPESALGKMFGIQKPERLGIMQFPKMETRSLNAKSTIDNLKTELQKIHDRKIELQSALVIQKRRVNQLAMNLATVLVAEKYKIDIATLIGLMSEDFNIKDLDQIYNSKENFKKWLLLTEDIFKGLMSENSNLLLNSDISEINPQDLLKYAQLAKDKAELLKKNSHLNKTLKLLYISSREIGEKLIHNIPLVNLGRDKLSDLKSIYVNRFIAEQGRREFWTDYPVSILLFGLVGGRADSSDPENLAAGTTMKIGDTEVSLPWFYFATNPMHYYDMVYTLIAGLFTSFARMTLVFQEQQKSLPENSYLPKQFFTLQSEDRKQDIWSAFWDWGKNVMNFQKSDLGGVFARSYMARIATLQAGLVMTTVLRLMFVPVAPDISFFQNMYMASAGFFLYMFWSQWQYGYIDDIVRKGNELFFKNFQKLNAEYDQSKLLIDRGLSETSDELALKLLNEGYSKLFKLYELQNKKALQNITSQFKELVRPKLNSQELESFNKNTSHLSAQEKSYLGLVIEATHALENQEQQRFEAAIASLRTVLQENHSLDSLEIQKLNARSLLAFSLTNPPIYTQENKLFFWVTQVSSLIWGTYLSIDLSIMIFNPSLLTPLSLGYTALLSASFVPLSLLLFGKSAWSYYNKIYLNIKNSTATTYKNTSASILNLFRKPSIQDNSCLNYFH